MHCISRWILAVATCAICAMVAAPALAQDSVTLKRIKDKKTIVLGVREASVPFSYLDDKKQYVGYSVDLCMKIVDAVKAELKMPDLKVSMMTVVPSARVQMVMNGDVDLECGSTTNSVERQKMVSFVVTTFFTGTRMLVKTSSKIKDYKDLKGKPVVVTSGTTNERAIKNYNLDESLNMRFVHVKDHNEALAALDNGSAAAFPMDDVLLYSMRASAKNPADYAVVGDFLTDEPYGIMIRKDDAPFKKLADGAVTALFKNGDINKIYARWFESPIPPKNVNLNMSMNSALKKNIRSPNHDGVDHCGRMHCMLMQRREM
ncbi:MAG: amino acid ABC transporter substrate-binding protein [Betaproteobacteria bacterium]|nr:amino acid ABC transporter substrate-binding protein [Betaproteobacteria bacterium]